MPAAMNNQNDLDVMSLVSKHPHVFNGPAVNFFEGALLGNGGLGVVVCTRPDAVLLHFGHNAVWDIRIAENHRDRMGTFEEISRRVEKIKARHLVHDSWYSEYCRNMRENYDKPYPRPFPCGTLLLGFDRRLPCEVLGHRLDPGTGCCFVRLLAGREELALEIFMERVRDRIWLRVLDAKGDLHASPFDRIRLIPDAATPPEFPPAASPLPAREDVLCFRQVLPKSESGVVGDPGDRAFRLSVRTAKTMQRTERICWNLDVEKMEECEGAFQDRTPFVACAQLDHGPANVVPDAGWPDLPQPEPENFASAWRENCDGWEAFWRKSCVSLEDEELERVWYHNLYFLNCAVREGVTCPGLFANWSLGKIGTAWHGDYHMNYNTQQPFWVAFSSNHVEKHLPYVDLVDFLLPVSRRHAHDFYGLPGAYFPHSAYPVEMTMMPYPVPTWGWEICETPWTVQSLWWHFLYTQDREFLRSRAYGPMREAVLFLAAYMNRADARGPRWGDDKFHIFPTVSPEMHGGLRPGFELNCDCIVDLTLTRFLFRAFLEARRVLGISQDEKLAEDVETILNYFPEYPKAQTPQGEVFVNAPGEPPDLVFNTPNTLAHVFPGEEFGIGSPPEIRKILENTLARHRNEGGNDLVFLNLQAARIGRLDLERFKRQIVYCRLPNGTCTDKCLQSGGRYSDSTAFDFMAGMGIWFENFALPAVINECLLQSYDSVLRFFPNWPKSKDAAFENLRAAGAFLVSARLANGSVQRIGILSEAGGLLQLVSPWPHTVCRRKNREPEIMEGALIRLEAVPGESYLFEPAFPA